MDLEAPADAWYVWVGVALASVAAVGVVLGLPSGPPPDANAAANTIDRVAGSAYEGNATYEHDARSYWVDRERIAMKNDDGVAKATLAYGPAVPVEGDGKLEAILHGKEVSDEYSPQSNRTRMSGVHQQFHEDVEDAMTRVDSVDPEWCGADGTLYVRVVDYTLPEGGEERAVLVDM